MEFVCVTVDCRDPVRVATFWNDALRWRGVIADGADRATCSPGDGGAYLEFVRVPEAKTIKNRMHLGLNAGTLVELTAELERLVDLGASVAWEEKFPPHVAATYRNVVLRDPEGNEFCLGGGTLPQGPPT